MPTNDFNAPKSFDPTLAEPARRNRLTAVSPHQRRKDKLRLAVALAVASGLEADSVFPPVFRALAGLGVPVRPLHFLPAIGLFLIGTMLGALIFGTIMASGLPAQVSSGPLAGMHTLGWPGIGFMAIFVGTGFSWLIKAQAYRHGLPHWNDI